MNQTDWIIGKTHIVQLVVMPHATVNQNSSRLPRWTCNSPIWQGPRHNPFPDWPWTYTQFAFPFLIGGGYKPYFAQGRTKRKYKKESQEGLLPLLQGCLLPSLGCSLSTVSVIKVLSAWAVTSLLFQNLATRQELRNPACLSYSNYN